jgi:trigger factor
MQLTQTQSDGLRRQFKVVVAATDLATRYESEIENIKGRVNINGFRPGKVPVAHIKKLYGRSIMADVVQNAVSDAQKKIVEDNAIRLANEPKVNLTEDKDAIEAVLSGKADLDFSIDVEVLPKIEVLDHSGLNLVKQVAEVPESDIDDAINRMAAAQRPFSPRDVKEKAEDGDKLTIDFLGTINGVAFQGGTAEGADLVLGSGQFIPGFEEQLVGVKAGDQTVVKVMFPESYQAVDLAGKAAEFAVTVKAIQKPGDMAIDDELAKKFGLDTLDALRMAVKGSMQEEINEQSRQKLKRQLLDGLDTLYTFELPPTMLEQEIATVWNQVTQDMQREGKSFAGDIEGETKARQEYARIAARRVRLGLVLAEIGERAEVKITDDEITQALIQRARQFPGQEKQVLEFYRKNPQALAEVRAPLFEEKVVDHILAGITVSEKSVTREELMRVEEADAEEAPAPAEKPKKAKAKKSDAE